MCDADIRATTVFGGKYVSLTTPKNPTPQRITPQRRDRCAVGDDRDQHRVPDDHLDRAAGRSGQAEPDAERGRASAERAGRQVRPVDRQRQRRPRRRQPAACRRSVATSSSWRRLGDTYANAAPDLFDFLNNAVITARTINRAAKGPGPSAVVGRRIRQHRRATSSSAAGRIWLRGAADLVPTAQLLDTYSPELFCTDPQLPRRRTQGRRVPGRQRLLAEPTPSCYPGWAFAEPGFGGSRHRLGSAARRTGRRCAEPLYLAGQPAAGERQRRARAVRRVAGSTSPVICGRRRTW